MQRLTTLVFLQVLFLLSIAAPLQAQWLGLPTPGIPRTADGEPDLTAPAPEFADGRPDMSGQWVPADARGTLFDPDKIQPWAREAMARHESNFYADDPRFSCLPSGPGAYPAGISVGGSRRIVQHPEFIAVLNPDMTYRQIYMDGRTLEEDPFPSWLGYSIGYWDGGTLVVESNGYNDKTWLTREGLPHTGQLHITERYQRLDFGHIALEVTYDDPGTFTGPVQASIDLEYRDSGMLEIVCNESSRIGSDWSGEISQAEEKVVEVPEQVLEQYVGTYQGVWLGNLITAEVILEDGDLSLVRTPRYSDTGGNTGSATYELIPQSENAFDCSCGLGFIFNANDEGEITEVSEVHVSGAWPFKRVN